MRNAITGAISAEERIIAPIPEDKREDFIDCLKLITDPGLPAIEDRPQPSRNAHNSQRSDRATD